MDDDTDDAYWEKLIPVWSRILTGVVILLVVMAVVGGWWLWHISNNKIVIVRTPTAPPQHSSARSPFAVLTARALSAVPPVATATRTPTPKPINGLRKWPLRGASGY